MINYSSSKIFKGNIVQIARWNGDTGLVEVTFDYVPISDKVNNMEISVDAIFPSHSSTKTFKAVAITQDTDNDNKLMCDFVTKSKEISADVGVGDPYILKVTYYDTSASGSIVNDYKDTENTEETN